MMSIEDARTEWIALSTKLRVTQIVDFPKEAGIQKMTNRMNRLELFLQTNDPSFDKIVDVMTHTIPTRNCMASRRFKVCDRLLAKLEARKLKNIQ